MPCEDPSCMNCASARVLAGEVEIVEVSELTHEALIILVCHSSYWAGRLDLSAAAKGEKDGEQDALVAKLYRVGAAEACNELRERLGLVPDVGEVFPEAS